MVAEIDDRHEEGFTWPSVSSAAGLHHLQIQMLLRTITSHLHCIRDLCLKVKWALRSLTVARPHKMSDADTPSAPPIRFVSVLALSTCHCRVAFTEALQPGRPVCMGM